MSLWRSTRRSTRGEQPDEGVEVGEKNDQIALRRIVAGREIPRNAKIAIRQRQVYGFFGSCRNCAFFGVE